MTSSRPTYLVRVGDRYVIGWAWLTKPVDSPELLRLPGQDNYAILGTQAQVDHAPRDARMWWERGRAERIAAQIGGVVEARER